MTTLATPWHGGRRAARRRRRLATIVVVLAFLFAALLVVAVATPLFGVVQEAIRWPGSAGPGGTPVAAPADSDEGDTAAVPEPEPPESVDPLGGEPGDSPVDAPEPSGDGDSEVDLPDEPLEAAHEDNPPEPAEDTADAGGDLWGPEGTAEVEDVQRRLRELGFLLGEVDGVKGQQTVAAVMAFQRVNDLQVDGVVGPQTLTALGDPVEPVLAGGPATRIEVDLDRQLLHVVDVGERIVTLHVSSGNGGTYRTASGGTAYSRTPVGEFVVERRIHGVRRSRLGILYDPLYFYKGWAIHGSPSVPAHPASHGCIRVARADGRWLLDHIENGTPVHLYGGTHVFTPSGRT